MNDQQRLFAQLAAFLQPIAESSGLKLRPFSVNLFSMTRMAGLSIGGAEFAALSDADRERQLAALLVIQTCPDSVALGRALRAAAGDFEVFYWDFVFERARDISVEALPLVEEQLAAELPAIEAAQVEVIVPSHLKPSSEEKAPGN